MATKSKVYVVWVGRKPGIYQTWDECKAQVDGFTSARYKSFASRTEAVQAYAQSHTQHIAVRNEPSARTAHTRPVNRGNFIRESYSVDAACSGNPGVLEYQCVRTDSREVVFRRGPFPQGTNNIGEFLAIVQALMWLSEHHETAPVYSDSKIALGWVKAKKCRTTLRPSTGNANLFRSVEQAEKWLGESHYPNKLLKWKTEEWGENPADFGRK
jgi:ribonuclease HI